MRQVAKEKGIDYKGELYAETNTQQLFKDLAEKVYRSTDEKLKVKTMLYQIYHHWYATSSSYNRKSNTKSSE